MGKYTNKKVLIVGFGKTGQSAARYLHGQGAKVTVTDIKSRADFHEPLKAMAQTDIQFEFGRVDPSLFQTPDIIVLSPGVPRSMPEVQQALARGAVVTNDLEIAYEHIKAPIVAVTGTNGKTTVTTMISQMLTYDGKKVFTGGNIGTPVLDLLLENQAPDVVVLEVSSFQAESIDQFRGHVTVLTNLEPDHMDRYSQLQDYYDAKRRLISNASSQSILVTNADNPPAWEWATSFPGKVLAFTRKDPLTLPQQGEGFRGVYLKRPKMVAKMDGNEKTFDLMASKLPGDHNRENWMAAAAAALSLGCSSQAIQRTIAEFRGVPHRLEFLRRKDGVSIYNDSKATNVASVVRSLSSFQAPIILIAGGRDKDQDFAPLTELVRKRVKNLILIGESKEKINRALGDFSETFLVGTFEEAVLLAYQKSRSGDVVLFSPACASYDMFRNYEERGEHFKKLVAQL